jgi:two-component system C4-dicarboxylate transport sensor histidine kinase DctB
MNVTRVRLSPTALLGLLGLSVILLWGAIALSRHVGVSRLTEAANHRLDLYSASLEGALGKYDYLTGVAALRQEIRSVLLHPASPDMRDATNRYLAEVNRQSGADVLFLIDRNGRVLAASNWDEPSSFVNRELSYRPYIAEALTKGQARFYGIGTTSGTPGYYFAQAVYNGSERIGVIVVKVSLDKVEATWANNDEVVLVVDAHGVVFLASDPRWKFKTLGPLQPTAIATIEATRQYAGVVLTPLELNIEPERLGGARVMSAMQNDGFKRYLELTHATPEPSWRLMLLSDLEPVSALTRNAIAFTLVALGLIGLAMMYTRQRQIAMRDGLTARVALQRANDELEQKVAERTAALVDANTQLVREVAERKHAEAVLREAQNALVHAAKMAALGQMSAGVTHELNQPLAALRTLSDNAQVFLQRGQQDDATGNLAMISQLTERMGKITGQLKSFARKAPLQVNAVSVRHVLDNSLALLGQRLGKAGVELSEHISPADISVVADENRLEQVFINLLMNALDALQDTTSGRIVVSAGEASGRVTIAIADNGPGIAPEVLARMFEPFVTTKAPGYGLGLGLAISAGILGEFGGTLKAQNGDAGGAIFTLELTSAKAE